MTGRHIVPGRRDRLPAAVRATRARPEESGARARRRRTRTARDEGIGERVRAPLVDPRAWARAVRERGWAVFAFTVVVTALAAFYAFRSAPVYRADATVLIEAEDRFRTGVELLRSRTLARQVVDELQLSRDPAFAANDPDPRTGVATVDREGVVDELLSRLHLERVASTDLVRLGVESPEPARAALIANALADAATSFELDGAAGSMGVRLVDRAAVPDAAAGPAPWQIVALAAIAALLTSVLAAIARDRADDTIRTEEDVERGIGLPLLGALPAIPDDAPGRSRARSRGRSRPRSRRRPAGRGRDLPPGDPVETAERHGAFGEAMDRARTVVCLRDGGRRHHVLLVTSSEAGEGRSTAALGLAYALSGAERVLLIDADVDRPAIGTAAGMEFDAPGLTDVLVGAVRAGRAIRRDAFYRSFDVLPCGPVPERPTELLTSPRFATLLTLLEDHYDRIVIDCGPVRAEADALAFARLADAVVFVARARRTRIDTARRALRRLSRAGVSIAGVLVTRVDARRLADWGADADEGRDDVGKGQHRNDARLVLTRRERRALQRDDEDFELGMSVSRPPTNRAAAPPARPTGRDERTEPSATRTVPKPAKRVAAKATARRATRRRATRTESALDVTDPTEDLSQELAPDASASVPYDPLAYDPDVDDVYADRDVNALVARLMADATIRRPSPDRPSDAGMDVGSERGDDRDASRRPDDEGGFARDDPDTP